MKLILPLLAAAAFVGLWLYGRHGCPVCNPDIGATEHDGHTWTYTAPPEWVTTTSPRWDN